jgi:hypothetical protein
VSFNSAPDLILASPSAAVDEPLQADGSFTQLRRDAQILQGMTAKPGDRPDASSFAPSSLSAEGLATAAGARLTGSKFAFGILLGEKDAVQPDEPKPQQESSSKRQTPSSLSPGTKQQESQVTEEEFDQMLEDFKPQIQGKEGPVLRSLLSPRPLQFVRQ